MCKKPSAIFAIIAIIIGFATKETNSICIEQICDTLQDVPLKNVQQQWTYVHFSSWFPSSLQFLPARFFPENGQLRYVTFKKILGGVHRDSLDGLDNLETIVFQNNVLPKLPKDLFKHCPKLEKIVVKNCQLTTLERGTFDGLDNLEHLKIENNNLTEIRAGDIPKHLLELILANNQITYIQENAFYDMKQLQVLDLSENYLTTFEFKKYLIQTPRIHEIKIGSNYLDKLTQLPRLRHLKYFYIENNSLSTLDEHVFEHSLNVEVINLAGNNLQTISADHFAIAEMNKLNKLYLSYNNFRCIDVGLLKLFPNLKTLWIGMNNLNCSCYGQLDKYIIENSIISMYNYNVEIEKYNTCKQPSTIYLN